MSKTLFLIRHAKAMDRQNNQSDSERELDSVGLQNATRMGMNMEHQNVRPDIIISSPALRAHTTASLIAEQIKYDTSKIHHNPEIYEASTRTLLQVINQFKNEWSNVILVGHNPSISYLAEYITKDEIGNMTTCGVVRIEFDFDDWSLVSEDTGELISYQYPDLLNF
ncbi:histidine phosphatase family protein [Fulvivirga maritima]|uniref:SixA phosphatase family protein n=1 Tax=Fulvivirga maritima TaxID=2904247 RepID=UPI001F339B85|nr:histidine phosphatase family protein [Fulvivirga maritima]UII24936.1 histidine phosphatase family protein [Fulvivirga maritima]